ncbi:MAG: ABC transporter ATP-binding protein [Clostridia bacterium]|nr:ABC transporter ATP-binding protein [Clostridia bacterium]
MPFDNPILKTDRLHVSFGRARNKFIAVKDVSFDIYQGETFGLVGESGSGKTTIGRTIIRIHRAYSGSVFFKGQIISGRIERELDRELPQRIQMIFQDPMASLNERAKIDYIVSEGIRGRGLPKKEIDKRVEAALLDVGLLPEFAYRFPHEFSGGQRQRIGIARALIMNPEIIIADEPISALDVSIRAQILNLMADLKKKCGLTYLFISHDLSVMRFICDRIAVIHLGRIVEMAETETLFKHPIHPYTKALLSAVPQPNPQVEKRKKLIVYSPAMHHYDTYLPSFVQIEPDHYVYANTPEIEEYQSAYHQTEPV